MLFFLFFLLKEKIVIFGAGIAFYLITGDILLQLKIKELFQD